MLNKLKKNNKKGFTLVELIVVLVILAILAALLIPALTGYIDKAKEKQIIAETRQVVMAAQTLVDEAYATKNVGGAVEIGANGVKKSDIAKLAEVDNANITLVDVGTGDLAGVVVKVVYKRDGKTCTYEKTAANVAGTYTPS